MDTKIGDKEFLSLDLEGARDYLLAYLTSAKRYEQDIKTAQAELKVWTDRVALAEKAGKTELVGPAQKRAADIADKLKKLEDERASILSETRRIRDRLPMLKASKRSIDPERLCAELDLLSGKILDTDADKAAAELAKLEKDKAADDALAALKKKL